MRVAVLGLLVACSTPAPAGPDAASDAGAPDVRADARPTGDGPPPPMSGILVSGPDLLSKTGLYEDIATKKLAADVIPFTPRWSLWSDGSEKQRWVHIPSGMTVNTNDMNQWTFPVGTKLWKEFKVGSTVVETRLLWKVKDGGWQYWWMMAYRWRADGTDADAVLHGEKDARGTMHDIPSQVDCVRCHFGVQDVGIGFSAIQLSAPMNSQLAKFSSMGLLSKPATQEYDAPGTGVEHDALAYMHVNCGHCHVESSPLYTMQTKLVLRLRTSDTTPQETGAYSAIGMAAKHNSVTHGLLNISPGKPNESQVWTRMGLRDFWAMPPIATEVVDQPNHKLVGDWITSLPPLQDN